MNSELFITLSEYKQHDRYTVILKSGKTFENVEVNVNTGISYRRTSDVIIITDHGKRYWIEIEQIAAIGYLGEER